MFNQSLILLQTARKGGRVRFERDQQVSNDSDAHRERFEDRFGQAALLSRLQLSDHPLEWCRRAQCQLAIRRDAPIPSSRLAGLMLRGAHKARRA